MRFGACARAPFRFDGREAQATKIRDESKHDRRLKVFAGRAYRAHNRRCMFMIVIQANAKARSDGKYKEHK